MLNGAHVQLAWHGWQPNRHQDSQSITLLVPVAQLQLLVIPKCVIFRTSTWSENFKYECLWIYDNYFNLLIALMDGLISDTTSALETQVKFMRVVVITDMGLTLLDSTQELLDIASLENTLQFFQLPLHWQTRKTSLTVHVTMDSLHQVTGFQLIEETVKVTLLALEMLFTTKSLHGQDLSHNHKVNWLA